jgi:hypothetical protein
MHDSRIQAATGSRDRFRLRKIRRGNSVLKRLMVDIETWSTRPDAAIRSIGACVINGDTISEAYYENVTDDSTIAFHHDPNTVQWWSEQNEDAQKAFKTGARPMPEVMRAFVEFVRRHKPDEIWANGAQFDIICLEWSMMICRVTVPWKYDTVRDLRTMRKLFKGRYEYARDEHSTEHNAFQDAYQQARELVAILKHLNVEL